MSIKYNDILIFSFSTNEYTSYFRNTAEREKAAMIGVSGLVTPSLDEMIHIAKEANKQAYTSS